MISSYTPLILLFILVDDLSKSVLQANLDYLPHIKKFTEQSTQYNRFSSAGVVCNPTRISLLFGMTPKESGVYTNTDFNFRTKHPTAQSLIQRLRTELGYAVYGTGKIYHGKYAQQERHTFTRFVGEDHDIQLTASEANCTSLTNYTQYGRFESWQVGRACLPTDVFRVRMFIRRLHANAETRAAYFFGNVRPHSPFSYWERDTRRQVNDTFGKFSTTAIPEYMRPWNQTETFDNTTIKTGYARSLLLLDRAVGSMIRMLQLRGEWNRTLVVLTADQGFSLGSNNWWGKGVLTPEVINAPLYISWPHDRTARVCNEVVAQNNLASLLVQELNGTATALQRCQDTGPARSFGLVETLQSVMTRVSLVVNNMTQFSLY